jgi:hypothetical protein
MATTVMQFSQYRENIFMRLLEGVGDSTVALPPQTLLTLFPEPMVYTTIL